MRRIPRPPPPKRALQTRKNNLLVLPSRIKTADEIRQEEIARVQMALKTNNIHHSYWYIKMKVGPAHWQSLDDDGDDRIACFPGNEFPVVRACDDLYGDYADCLAACFKWANPDADFTPRLTNTKQLNVHGKDRWYVWGEKVVDLCCGECGMIARWNITQPMPTCYCGEGWREFDKEK